MDGVYGGKVEGSVRRETVRRDGRGTGYKQRAWVGRRRK